MNALAKGALAGAGAGVVVIGVAALVKARQFTVRGEQLAAGLAAGGGALEQLLLLEKKEIEQDLRSIARKMAESLAESWADRYIREAYGVTDARVRQLQRYFG